MELSNRRIVELWSYVVVKSLHRRMVELWRCAVVESSNGGMVELSNRRIVIWWSC